ncbi:MAG: amidohydrolase family protein [Flavobacteriales bacterium]
MQKFLCVLLVVNFISCSSERKKGTITIIKNVNFFDGEKYSENIDIAFHNGFMVKAEEDEYEGTTIIDGKGKTIIPPLLNAHVHVWSKQDLLTAQNAGVFATLDMHTTDYTAYSLRKYRDSTRYAFYYSAGPGATVPGGHGTQYGIAMPTINDSVSPEKFVRDRIMFKSDYIKILREPSMKTINFEQTNQVIKTSHFLSKLCVAHVSVLSDAMRLGSQNIDGFVHIWRRGAITNDQADSLVRRKIFIIPTLYVIKKSLEIIHREKTRKEYLSFDQVLNETRKLFKKGVPILAGTDAPNFNFNYGSDLYVELKLLSEAGLPNIEVLKAATTNISKCFKLKEFGKLEIGKPASFLMINGNPIKKIEDISKIEGIWKKGKRIK